MKDRKLCHHGLDLRLLERSAVGHHDRSRSDGRVKHLYKSLLGAYV